MAGCRRCLVLSLSFSSLWLAMQRERTTTTTGLLSAADEVNVAERKRTACLVDTGGGSTTRATGRLDNVAAAREEGRCRQPPLCVVVCKGEPVCTIVCGGEPRKKPYELQQIETARNRQRVSHRRSGRWRWMQNHDNNTTFSLEAEKPKREPHHPRRSKENHDELWMKTTTTIPEWSSKGG
uniref:Secreted protein n=1 Tax=Oryza rufipogon TaxID=4529 RepID=A0A0E0NUT3_ORYRU